MNLSVGIVGLPNVGKSTLFNALLKKQQAYVANYPFATVEPNIGVVPVLDERLEVLADVVAKELNPSTTLGTSRPPVVPATVQFVDIAGLVKGANQGAGLGNKFLSHIREVSIVAHVVRAFVDENVIREGSSDPESDYATIQTELMLSDMQVVDKAMANRKQSPSSLEVLKRINAALNSATPIRDLKFSESEKEVVGQLFLLCAKPEIIVLNVSEDQYSLVNIGAVTEQYSKLLLMPNSKLLLMPKDRFVVICAKIEAELSELSKEEQRTYLADLGLQTSGLERLIKKAYEELGLISFLTAGEKEVRAWTVRRGTKAVDAAGVIHTDFSKAFIKAEVISFEDFVQNRGWKKARELGKARFEGRDYIMQDGDVVEFKIGS